MKLKRYIFLILVLLSLFLQFACSQPCTMTVEQTPEIRGFRLLMTVQEIQAKHKDFPIPQANAFGLAKVVIENYTNSDYTRKSEMLSNRILSVNGSEYSELNGINRLYLDFVDGKIAEIRVFYSNELKWNSVDEFVRKTAESLQLKGNWENKNENYRLLSCSGVFVYSGIRRDYDRESDEKLPFIELTALSLSIEPDLRKHRNDANANLKEQERRDVFKP